MLGISELLSSVKMFPKINITCREKTLGQIKVTLQKMDDLYYNIDLTAECYYC